MTWPLPRPTEPGWAPQWSPLLGSGMTSPARLQPITTAMPQWSPLLGSGMTSLKGASLRALGAPQWSPLLGSGMTWKSESSAMPTSLPQWSPLLGSGMTCRHGGRRNLGGRAAMEPAPWERDDFAELGGSGGRPRSRNGARSLGAG